MWAMLHGRCLSLVGLGGLIFAHSFLAWDAAPGYLSMFAPSPAGLSLATLPQRPNALPVLIVVSRAIRIRRQTSV